MFMVGAVPHLRFGFVEGLHSPLHPPHHLVEPVPEEKTQDQLAGVVQQGRDLVVAELDLRFEGKQFPGVEFVGDEGAAHRVFPVAAQVEITFRRPRKAIDQLDLLSDGTHLF